MNFFSTFKIFSSLSAPLYLFRVAKVSLSILISKLFFDFFYSSKFYLDFLARPRCLGLQKSHFFQHTPNILTTIFENISQSPNNQTIIPTKKYPIPHQNIAKRAHAAYFF
ncbi:hypothetical protein DTQ70_23080 [Runella sp. SP2]|nr:hypothetical protein DTQ70_23080 [Runella sp. SP2]